TDTGFLHDAHDLTDLLLARSVDALRRGRFLADRALPDRAQEPLGLAREERKQEQLLFARSQTFRALAQSLHVDRPFVGTPAEQLDGARDRGIDRARRVTEAPADEIAELVDERAVAIRAEHVHDRL